MPPVVKRILPTLAILVVACAQVFGMQRGYVCQHWDMVIETDAAHCHRVVAAEKADFVPCARDSKKDCIEQGETEPHAPLMVQTEAATIAQAATPAPTFVAVLLSELPAFDLMLIQEITDSLMMKTPLDTGGESPPPAALQVAHCVVILV